MAKFESQTVNMWREDAAHWLAANTNLTLHDIKTGVDAWAVAHRSGITKEAYNDRTVTDGHIQTALEKIFPNAVFKDRKTY